MKKRLLILGAIALALPMTACNSQTTGQAAEVEPKPIHPVFQNIKEECLTKVKTVIDTHKLNLPGKMVLQVSENFVPNKQEFVNRTEENITQVLLSNVQPVIEHIQMKGTHTLIVKFSWNRSFARKTNLETVNDSGETTFVFTKDADDLWRLKKVTGSDVFSYN